MMDLEKLSTAELQALENEFKALSKKPSAFLSRASG